MPAHMSCASRHLFLCRVSLPSQNRLRAPAVQSTATSSLCSRWMRSQRSVAAQQKRTASCQPVSFRVLGLAAARSTLTAYGRRSCSYRCPYTAPPFPHSKPPAAATACCLLIGQDPAGRQWVCDLQGHLPVHHLQALQGGGAGLCGVAGQQGGRVGGSGWVCGCTSLAGLQVRVRGVAGDEEGWVGARGGWTTVASQGVCVAGLRRGRSGGCSACQQQRGR